MHTHQVITITTGTTTSGPDLDIQLFDKSDGGSPIVGYGLKSSTGLGDDSGEKSATYRGRTYHYSGFNGVDGQLGNEYVRINGITNTELTMKVGQDMDAYNTHTHTHVYTHTRTYTHTHTHAHTHVHRCMPTRRVLPRSRTPISGLSDRVLHTSTVQVYLA
jgi:hypothetical protein